MDKLPSKFMQRVDAIIQAKMHCTTFGVNVLREELAMSYSHMHRKIKQKTGLSPSMYVCEKRLEEACQLLKETEFNISEIALRVGFKTQTYFSTCFSTVYGLPPLQYRKK